MKIIENNLKLLSFKKTAKRIVAICFLFGALLTMGISNVQAKADGEIKVEKNGAYIVAAVPGQSEKGVAALYSSVDKKIVIEFDLLKGIENGFFGVAIGNENSLSNLSSDYFGVSKSGAIISSSKEIEPDKGFRFLSGYRYKLEYGEGMLRISRRQYGVYENIAYKEIYSGAYQFSENNSAIGIFLQSDNLESAYLLLDNLTIHKEDGLVIENSFNDAQTSIFGMLNSHSNDSCYDQIYKGATYTVVFTDGNGKEIKIVECVENNYAFCEEVAKTVGDKVLKGWSDDTNNVTKDMVVVPVYGAAEPNLPSETIEEKNGCSSVMSFGSAAILLLVASLLIKRKKAE